MLQLSLFDACVGDPELSECRCGAPAVFFKPRSGGNGARCTRCRNEIWHPSYTREDIAQCWAYTMHSGEFFKD